jgi:2-hydroxycyclohexanecarboxyl-CoA dehydrogenase
VSLAGRVSIVTGGASGIGRAIALRLARDGADVAVFDLDHDGAESVAAEVRAAGRRALAYDVDVASLEAMDAAVGRVRSELGPVTIAIANAGYGEVAPVERMTEAQWDRMMAVHAKGTFTLVRACLADMRAAKWGRVVATSSVAGLEGSANLVHYGAAKAAIVGFVKEGITVNAIAPGLIETPILERSGITARAIDFLVRRSAVGRAGKPDDIAAACAYLVSEEASFFTGQVMSPNGGLHV